MSSGSVRCFPHEGVKAFLQRCEMCYDATVHTDETCKDDYSRQKVLEVFPLKQMRWSAI